MSSSDIMIAVQGCLHGALDQVYHNISKYEERHKIKVDLLICCGDFQSLRNSTDFSSLAVPVKYRSMGDFYRYYSGERKAPVLTIFVGGNHENMKQLQELYYGGWVAPNIYYIGAAGVVKFGALRIGGLSGIFKHYDYTKGHYERPPYSPDTLRSVFHVRNVDVFRLRCLSRPREERPRLNIMVTHDWPRGVEKYGDTKSLLRRKKHFAQDIHHNRLGSNASEGLLHSLKPERWFSAHLHVKFEANVIHENAASGKNENHQNIQYASCIPCETESAPMMTKFLSLDKCLPGRQHFEILKFSQARTQSELYLEYDLEWLAILIKTHNLTSTSRERTYLPEELVSISDAELRDVKNRVQRQHRTIYGLSSQVELPDALRIPKNFIKTVPSFAEEVCSPLKNETWWNNGEMIGNPQTDAFLNMVQLHHIVTIPFLASMCKEEPNDAMKDDNQIDLDLSDATKDDNEIDLDTSDLSENDSVTNKFKQKDCKEELIDGREKRMKVG